MPLIQKALSAQHKKFKRCKACPARLCTAFITVIISDNRDRHKYTQNRADFTFDKIIERISENIVNFILSPGNRSIVRVPGLAG